MQSSTPRVTDLSRRTTAVGHETIREPDVVVIGAGQAGLSTSFFRSDRNINHVELGRGVLGNSWSKHRWDSFTLVTPNWTIRLPGAACRGPDPDGFMERDDFVAHLSDWSRRFDCPVRSGVTATDAFCGGNGLLRVNTADGPMETAGFVVATGSTQTPRRPPLVGSVSPRIRKLDVQSYLNPGDLAPGTDLLVGSGQTGGRPSTSCGYRVDRCR